MRAKREAVRRHGDRWGLAHERTTIKLLFRWEILSREELIELTGASGGGRAVDVQVTRLRRKIEQNPKLPRYLRTVRGKGYVLRPD